MLYIVLAVVLGILASIGAHWITIKAGRGNCIGALRVDQSDPSEAPYLFLELDPDGMQKICTHRIVSLRVRIEDYLPLSRK